MSQEEQQQPKAKAEAALDDSIVDIDQQADAAVAGAPTDGGPGGRGGGGGASRGVERLLKARHLTMIALGGTIGTGLYLATGSVIQSAGPLGALIAYAIVALMVYGVVTSLGEMATLVPTAGAFGEHTSRYVDGALGFTLGWNYWAAWATTLPSELSAAGVIVQYWAPNVDSWVWAIVFLVPLAFVNLVNVRGYGETEYWLSLIKVVFIVIFLLVGTALVLGANKDLGFIGGSNWNVPGAPIGASSTYEGSVDGARFVAILGAFTTAFYSFGGTEIVGVTAGESADPRRTVPVAIRGTFWRIVLFYFLSILLVGLIIPVTDDTLSVTSDVAVAPFTRVYELSGIKYADHIMNAVILVAVLSAANSSIYCSARTVMSLAQDGKAPAFLGRVDKHGTPRNAVILALLIGAITFLGTIWGNGVVFNFLVDVLGMSSLLSWVTINITHIRFRIGWVRQGHAVSELPYVSPFFPIPDILSLVIGVFILVGLLYSAITSPFDPIYDSSLYLGAPIFFLLYVGYAGLGWFGLAGIKWNGFVKYEDMDFVSGRSEVVQVPHVEDDIKKTPKEKVAAFFRRAVEIVA
ncbi:hypothetical protein HK405_001538 [Cladochytrium tenue]|nr:hypothetical protein HK405_001538 [Cladochytrium tenue]